MVFSSILITDRGLKTQKRRRKREGVRESGRDGRFASLKEATKTLLLLQRREGGLRGVIGFRGERVCGQVRE